MNISYPTVLSIGSNGDNYDYLYRDSEHDLQVSIDGLNASKTTLKDYSDWSVTAEWKDEQNQLQSTISHGSPFVYFERAGGNARITFNDNASSLIIWKNSGDVLGVTINGHHYGIFAPSGALWQQDGNTLVSDLNNKSYFSVALLPNNTQTTLTEFSNVAMNFVSNTRVTWEFDQSTSLLTSTYHWDTTPKESTQSSGTIFTLYPHQWKHVQSSLTPYTYQSPRGAMKAVSGIEFTVQQRFNGVLPGLPEMGIADQELLVSLLSEATNATNATNIRPDTYGAGKDLTKLTNLLPILEQQGDTEQRDVIINIVKNRLQDWFAGENQQSTLFDYNSEWQTLIGFPASFGSDDSLNDHHFHWGYFIQAAATIARYDQKWASDTQWGGMIKMLIRDAANPNRDDNLFPFLRNFDAYAGHSWASGHANFASGNNQESSSESMNFATGLILWGEATNNTAIRDLGIYLYTTENTAIANYWFDVDNDSYPAGYNHSNAAILWGSGSVYGTWWTAEPEAIHGINFLPFHGGSLYLGEHPENLEQNYNELVANNGGPEGSNGDPANSWTDIIWQAQAFYDGDAALDKFIQQIDSYSVESGESKAHTYHWLANLTALGQVDSSIWADIPTAAVFDNNNSKVYVAYNDSCNARTVNFSNGKTMTVTGKSMVAANSSQQLGQWSFGTCEWDQPESECSTLPVTINNNPAIFYLDKGILTNNVPGPYNSIIPANNGSNTAAPPTDETLLAVYEIKNLYATYNEGQFDFSLPINSDGSGNVTIAAIDVDTEGDGSVDFSVIYNFYAVDASSSTTEIYTAAKGVLSQTGSLGDLVNGSIRVTLWNGFGGEDVRISEGEAFIQTPYSF